MGLERLDKLLASQGIASRSEAGRMAREGRVQVDAASVVPLLKK